MSTRKPTLPAQSREDVAERWPTKRFDVLWALNRAAMAYWHRLLLGNPQVLSYIESRGWPDPVQIVRKYRLGYAPTFHDKAPSFVRHVLQTGFPETADTADLERALIAAGLAKRRERDGRVVDFFHGRLIFPIPRNVGFDQMGSAAAEIVGFGGRTLPWEEERAREAGRDVPPKYLNTPETVLFQKRKMLYGLPWAASAIHASGQVIILEGYLDYIRVKEAGFDNVLAQCGTALTADHMKAIARLAQVNRKDPALGRAMQINRWGRPLEIILATDADPAGRRAAERGARVALDAGFLARIASFEGGKDPDDLLRDAGAEGRELFAEVIKGAQTPVMNYLDVLSDRPAGSPWNDSLRALVATLRNLERRAAGAPETQQRYDAERVSSRLRLDMLPFEVDNLLDLFRRAEPAPLGMRDMEVGQ